MFGSVIVSVSDCVAVPFPFQGLQLGYIIIVPNFCSAQFPQFGHTENFRGNKFCGPRMLCTYTHVYDETFRELNFRGLRPIRENCENYAPRKSFTLPHLFLRVRGRPGYEAISFQETKNIPIMVVCDSMPVCMGAVFIFSTVLLPHVHYYKLLLCRPMNGPKF